MVKYSDYYIKTSKWERNNDFAYFFDKITTAIFKKPKLVNIKNPRKILIIRNDHIGDLLLTTPVFREIKKNFPDSKITVMADPVAKTIIEKNKNVDEIIPFGLFWRKKNIKSFLEYLRVLNKIKREKFDIGIDIRGSLLNIFFFLFLPRIKKRVAYFNKSGGVIFLTNPILYSKRESWHKTILEIVNKGLGMNSKNYWPEIITDKGDEKEVEKFLKENKIKKFISLIPGSSTKAKEWPIQKFDELIKKINKKYPEYKILLVGGGNDKHKINYLIKRNKNCVPVINFNLRWVAILFKKAKAIVGCDGGTREIAWVVKGNLVDLQGPVDLKLHPLFGGKNIKAIKHNVPCYPCNWSVPCKKPCGVWCMELITPNEVFKAIEEFIKNKEHK